MAGPVADLEEPLARGTAATGEPVAAVLARELHSELLEPVDRRRRLGGENLDELQVGSLVRGLPHVLGVLLGRVVSPKGGLDAALRLGGVARLQRTLARQTHARTRSGGGDGRGEARGSAADHEHVKGGVRHDSQTIPRFS